MNAKSVVVGSSLANGSQVTRQQQQKLAINDEDPSHPSSSSSGSTSLVLDRNNDNNDVHDDDDEFTFVQDERGLHKLEFVHTATTGGSNIELSGEFFLFLNKRKRERVCSTSLDTVTA